ncbi:unnamed protein product [Prorocentrum cordatum]|uniref:Uncharacterized protein n=1 Tax=Prorocentrum cordatum TaxID=2364126 RepID=A0ABN9QJI0_9DINO|nr:unnamed protein product [Polarella glacialis]
MCFKSMWHGSQRFPDHPDSRSLQVTAARIQGHEANMAMLQAAGAIPKPNVRRLAISKSDPDPCILATSPPAAPPATGPPAAPPQFGGLARGAGPQTALPMPPGRFFSASSGARPQTSAGKRRVLQSPKPAML